MANKTSILSEALITLVLCVLSLLLVQPSAAKFVSGANQGATAAPQSGLTPQERRGKAIYLRGESASGHQITATIGGVDVPASSLTCASCHGVHGEGKTEGGVSAGNTTWSHLLKSHTHPTGRKHALFDEASFTKALTAGIDPSGNQFLVAMPRYRLSATEIADLLAYLRRIESEVEPGLSDTAIRVGTVVPAQGALGDMGAAIRDLLSAYFEDLNARGGVYNRRVELRVVEMGADAAATQANVRRFISQEPVFAFVGGMSAGADTELMSLATETETPFIGPATLLTPTSSVNRHTFYLLPGFSEQARALVQVYLQGKPREEGRVAVVYANSVPATAAASAVEAQCIKVNCGGVQKVSYERAKFDAVSLVGSLKGTDAVFFFGDGGHEVAFLKEAATSGWTPSVFLLGALTGRDLTQTIPLGFKDKVIVAFPTVPADLTPDGVAEFRALQEKYKLPARHVAAQAGALAAAKVFVEALKRSGAGVTREALITALESFYEFETGLTRPITFGPSRRVGAAGATMVKIDPEKKEFVPASGWIPAY